MTPSDGEIAVLVESSGTRPVVKAEFNKLYVYSLSSCSPVFLIWYDKQACIFTLVSDGLLSLPHAKNVFNKNVHIANNVKRNKCHKKNVSRKKALRAIQG